MAKFLDNIAGSIGNAVAAYRNAVKGTIGDIPDWLSASAEGERWKNEPDMRIARNQLELYMRLSWVEIAVGHVARQVAGVPLGIKKLEDEKRIEVVNHPFELLLQRPNPSQSRFEFLEALMSYWAISGNGYAWLNKANKQAQPEEMWVIPSHRIKPVPDERMYIQGYLYDTGHGEELPIEPWEVMHIKRYNPLNQYVGLSPVEALAIVSEGDLAAQKYNTNYFGKNNAKASGIVAFASPINNPDWEKIKDDWRKQHGGTKRNLLMLRNTGDKGVNWVSTAMTQKDMEFLSGREFTKREIFAMFAPGLSSWLDVNSTEANSVTGKEAFKELAVWPANTALAEKITNDILPTYGDNLVAEFEDVRIEDKAQQLKEQEAYERSHTIAEVREKFYDDKPIGDERDDLIPSVASGEDRSGDEEKDIEVKTHEREQFRRFAKARGGKRKKLDTFKFKYLDIDEQEMLKGEFGTDDNVVLAELTNAIDALRAHDGKVELELNLGNDIKDIKSAVQEKPSITVNVEGAEPQEINVHVPEQKAPIVKNEIKVPKAKKQAAPVVNIENVVNVPETQVVIEKKEWTEEVTEVIERDTNDKLKKMRKTRKK